MIKQTKLNFKHLCMTIGNLPSSYVESLSYYECMLWLCNYLETVVVPTVNGNAEAVEELQALYIELKSYIDTYFDNLDVQEEINNKLDEMVEAGTLQEIIADYLNSKAVFGFDTVADMKEATNLIDGSYAETLGYHSKNDGGASLYKVRNITNDDVIDEATIISLAGDDLIAELIIKDVVNPEQFGAYGDGTHDDTTALQKMFDYIAINNKYKIMANKNYLISTTLNIVYNYADIEINGSITYTGNSGSAIKFTGIHSRLYVNKVTSSYDGILLEGNTTESCTYNEFNFNLIIAEHDGIIEYANTGFLQYNEFRFKNIRANNIGINLKTENNSNSWITETKYWGGHISHKVYGSYNAYCIYADGKSGERISTQKFYNIGFEGTDIGCYLNNCHSNIFENFRNRESIQSKLFVLVGNSGNNRFTGESIYMKWLDWSGLTATYPSIFRGTFWTNGGSTYNFSEFAIDKNGMRWCNQESMIYINYNNASLPPLGIDPSQSWYGFPNEILLGGDVDLKLDTKYYNYRNINQIIVRVTTSTSNAIKDQDGNVIIDLAGLNLAYKKLRITFVQENISNLTVNKTIIEDISSNVILSS